MNKEQIRWINCAKCIAILAVMLDHAYSILYQSEGVQTATHFSVPLFILLSGVTAYLTGEKYVSMNWGASLRKKTKRLLIAYLCATCVYLLVWTGRFDLVDFLHALVHFDASPPLYFVALYLQLMLLWKPLYLLLQRVSSERFGWLYELLMGAALFFFSVLTTNRTDILGIAGGGGKLFGGSFLFLFYLGMLLEKHRCFHMEQRQYLAVCTCIFLPLTIVWELLICRQGLFLDHIPLFGKGQNPPGVTLMIASLLMLFLCFFLFTLLEKQKVTRQPVLLLDYLGRHSLYLFLYHRLFLDIVNHFLREVLPPVGNWIVCFAAMLIGPLVMEQLFRAIRRAYMRCTAKEETGA